MGTDQELPLRHVYCQLVVIGGRAAGDHTALSWPWRNIICISSALSPLDWRPTSAYIREALGRAGASKSVNIPNRGLPHSDCHGDILEIRGRGW